MAVLRRTVLGFLAVTLVTLALLLAAGAGRPETARAAEPSLLPQQGPVNQAFLDALRRPSVARGLGRMPSPVEIHVGTAARARAARLALPSAYDLREQGLLTDVKDQGNHNTCWAFADVAALESKLLMAGETWDFSEDNLVRRSGYFSTMSQRYNSGGWDFMAVAYLARWAGPVTETDDPYDSRDGTSVTRKHVQGVVMIPGRAGATDNDIIKELVLQNGALSVGMHWDGDGSPYSQSEDRQGVVCATYYSPERHAENHGVAIVGWDDAYPASAFAGDDGSPPGDGAFLVRNSWGPAWGDAGYFWVSYYDGSFALDRGEGTWGGGASFSDVRDASSYSRVYQYDPLGVNDHWGFNSTRAWGANRFTAKQTQTIAAASFYTLASSTRYEVWAGRTFSSLSLRASGSAGLPGYVTVPFDKDLRVSEHKTFIVAVKLLSPGEAYPLAVERRVKGWSPLASARPGQSFMSRNGSTWIDATSVRASMNVCLKAFAE